MTLKQTPFYQYHQDLGAKMGPFAGWDMPIQYKDGILAEHRQCRESVAVFDTSHMGEFLFKGDIAASGIEQAVTFSIQDLAIGRCKYGLMLNDQGGIIDDLIIYRMAADELFIVVNAGTIDKDYGNLHQHIKDDSKLENISDKTAKLDVQGPLSYTVLSTILDDDISTLKYFQNRRISLYNEPAIISRTGYTGELGYELYASAPVLQRLWGALMLDERVAPAGLGARDVLRLEMGYSLYGSDMDDHANPLEYGLADFVDMNKDFSGKAALEQFIQNGLTMDRVAFQTLSRRSPRSHFDIVVNGQAVGTVTSGTYSPLTGTGIGIGIMPRNLIESGNVISVVNGNTSIEAEIVDLPFYEQGSARKKI